MPVFVYKGIDAGGKSVKGDMDAADRKAVVRKLMADKIRPTSIEAKDEKDNLSFTADENIDFFKSQRSASSKAKLLKSKPSGNKLAREFFQNVYVLITNGLSLGDTLRLLSTRLADPHQKELCTSLWKKISEGRTLAASMKEMPDVFNDSTVHLIEAGEASGNLASLMERVCSYMEESENLKKKVQASLAYPLIVVSIAICVVLFMLFFLLPRIRGMMESLGGEMHISAKILIGGSEFLLNYGIFIIIGVTLFSIFIARWRKTVKGLYETDKWLLQLPVMGQILLYNSIYKTTSLMATLLSSGINTTECLRLVEKTIPNVQLKAKFIAARKQIHEGVSMATAIRRVNYMPDVAMDILTVGENTGNISSSLDNINKIYRNELTKRMDLLTNMISTIALIGAFILVGLIAISVVTSVFSVSKSLQM